MRLITDLVDGASLVVIDSTESSTLFINEWVKTDCLMNQWITVKNINQKMEGKVTGINEQGHLLLRLEDGKARAFSSGDTSVMKRVEY